MVSKVFISMFKALKNLRLRGNGTLIAATVVLLVTVGALFGIYAKLFYPLFASGSEQAVTSPLARDSVAPATSVEEGQSGGNRSMDSSERVALELEAALEDPEQSVKERLRAISNLRGARILDREKEAAYTFLQGRDWPNGMSPGSAHWLADEILTALRLQQPPDPGMVGELASIAEDSSTDSVIRDYIMQHLGHFWEQYGFQVEIEEVLRRGVGFQGETTSGSALLALWRGYRRENQLEMLDETERLAFELASNSTTHLSTRMTALSILGDTDSANARKYARRVIMDPTEPEVIRRIAAMVVESHGSQESEGRDRQRSAR